MFTLNMMGLAALLLSGFRFFAKDTVWKLTFWCNQFQGVRSERTPQWELATVVQGIVLLIVGIFLFGLGSTLGPDGMSGVYIGGLQLTRSEAQSYHKDPVRFIAWFCSQSPSSCQNH